MVWRFMGNAKMCEGVVQLEEWSQEKKMQGMECHSSSIDVGHLKRKK